MRRLAHVVLIALAVGLTPSRAQDTALDSACTYETCALRVESGFLSTRLVRGRDGEPVGRQGLFGSPLSDLVAASPRALEHAHSYERARAPAFYLVLGSAVLVNLFLYDVGSDEFQIGAALGGLGLIAASIPFSVRSQREFSRAVWEYNGSLPTDEAPSRLAQNRGGGLFILSDRQVYAPADSITLTVINESDRVLGYGLCLGTLERQTPEGWESVQKFYEDPKYGAIDECELDWRGLSGGGRTSESYRLSRYLAEGTYRWCGNETEYPTPTSGRPVPRLSCTVPFEIQS